MQQKILFMCSCNKSDKLSWCKQEWQKQWKKLQQVEKVHYYTTYLHQ